MGERLTGRGTTWIRLLAIVPLLPAGIAVGAPSLASAATVCNKGEVYQVGGTFEGAVVVDANTQCRLNMATIRGGVTVEPGGCLFTDNAEIRGSVSGSDVNSVIIGGGVVRG